MTTNPTVHLPDDALHQPAVIVLAADVRAEVAHSPEYLQVEALEDALFERAGFLGFQRPKEDFTPVSRSAKVTALVRDVTTGECGRQIRFLTTDGARAELYVSDAEFHQNQAGLLAELARRGLFISPTAEAKRLLLEHLLRQEPQERLRTAAPSWVQLDAQRAYLLPTGTVGPPNLAGHLAVRSGAAAVAKYALAGGTGEWASRLGVLCRGNSRLLFATSLAFASMLLAHTTQGGFGVHFFGRSGDGKSTTMQLTTSIHGCSVNQWLSTANALEGLAAEYNHQVLVLDELGQLDPKSAPGVIYLLANGRGKQRAGRTGAGRIPAVWKVVVVSAGEISFAQHAAQAGQTLKAGQEIRMLDIEAAPQGAHGVFEQLHGFVGGAELSKEIQARVAHVRGWPALEFARFLIERPSVLTEIAARVNGVADRMVARHLHVEASAVIRRGAEQFALAAVAGELAAEAGITGWTPGDATWGATVCFENWVANRPADDDEQQDPVERIKSVILEKMAQLQDLRYVGAGGSKVVSHRIGWIAKTPEPPETGLGYEFWIIPRVFQEEILRGLPRNKTLRLLADAGVLKTRMDGERRRYDIRRRHGEEFFTVYVVSASIFEGSKQDYEESPAFKPARYDDDRD